ncbi:MAG: sll1863 family stress response protein [Leptospirales bacterium]
MDTKEAYKEKINAQLKEWNAQIKLLSAKMDNAKADAKLKYAQELGDIRTKCDEATNVLKELEKTSGEVWEKTKATTEKLWGDLKTGIDQALSKLK